MGGEFFIPLNAPNCQAAGAAAGDRVQVELERDDAPREVEVPAAPATALTDHPQARATFATLSYSRRHRAV